MQYFRDCCVVLNWITLKLMVNIIPKIVMVMVEERTTIQEGLNFAVNALGQQ